jgi:predicted Zn-dependent peptidase
MLYGDAREADQRVARLQAVQAADVQRVLQHYLLRGHRVIIDYVQGAAS